MRGMWWGTARHSQHHKRHSFAAVSDAHMSRLRTFGRYLSTTSPAAPGASSSCAGRELKYGPLATTDSCMGSWLQSLLSCRSWSAHW